MACVAVRIRPACAVVLGHLVFEYRRSTVAGGSRPAQFYLPVAGSGGQALRRGRSGCRKLIYRHGLRRRHDIIATEIPHGNDDSSFSGHVGKGNRPYRAGAGKSSLRYRAGPVRGGDIAARKPRHRLAECERNTGGIGCAAGSARLRRREGHIGERQQGDGVTGLKALVGCTVCPCPGRQVDRFVSGRYGQVEINFAFRIGIHVFYTIHAVRHIRRLCAGCAADAARGDGGDAAYARKRERIAVYVLPHAVCTPTGCAAALAASDGFRTRAARRLHRSAENTDGTSGAGSTAADARATGSTLERASCGGNGSSPDGYYSAVPGAAPADARATFDAGSTVGREHAAAYGDVAAGGGL